MGPVGASSNKIASVIKPRLLILLSPCFDRLSKCAPAICRRVTCFFLETLLAGVTSLFDTIDELIGAHDSSDSREDHFFGVALLPFGVRSGTVRDNEHAISEIVR